MCIESKRRATATVDGLLEALDTLSGFQSICTEMRIDQQFGIVDDSMEFIKIALVDGSPEDEV